MAEQKEVINVFLWVILNYPVSFPVSSTCKWLSCIFTVAVEYKNPQYGQGNQLKN